MNSITISENLFVCFLGANFNRWKSFSQNPRILQHIGKSQTISEITLSNENKSDESISLVKYFVHYNIGLRSLLRGVYM